MSSTEVEAGSSSQSVAPTDVAPTTKLQGVGVVERLDDTYWKAVAANEPPVPVPSGAKKKDNLMQKVRNPWRA